MVEVDPWFQRMSDRHAVRQRQHRINEAAERERRRAEVLRSVPVTPWQPGESEPLTAEQGDGEHLGHRTHFCFPVTRCQCGAVVGLSCFVPPGPGEVVPACQVCIYHGLPADDWVGEEFDD